MSKMPVSRTCPKCGGKGTSGITILGGDKFCGKCEGKGTIIEFVDVPEERSRERSSSADSSSNSSDGDGGCILAFIGVIILIFVLILVLIFAPFIFAGILVYFGLSTGWKVIPYWIKAIWAGSWFLVPLIYKADFFDFFDLLSSFASQYRFVYPLLDSYKWFGLLAIVLILGEAGIEIYHNQKIANHYE